ncbi:hypothetical protein D3C75_419500 [compost metagenome]
MKGFILKKDKPYTAHNALHSCNLIPENLQSADPFFQFSVNMYNAEQNRDSCRNMNHYCQQHAVRPISEGKGQATRKQSQNEISR